jgi:transcriptional regulator with XRE-family HTH domain
MRAGLTQQRLAERAGISVRGLSDLERGARLAPRRDTVLRLSEALGLGDQERAVLMAARRKTAAVAPRPTVVDSTPGAARNAFPGLVTSCF